MIIQGQAVPLVAMRNYASKEDVKIMDDAAFEAFYRKHARRTWGRLYRITGDGAAADDLLQRAFLKFLVEADAARSEGELVSFLGRIATNLALDDKRRDKRRPEDELPEMIAVEAAGGSELRQDVGKALDALEPRERAMLWMAHVDGFSHAEIADAISVGTASVKVLLHRARRKLAGVLEQMGMGLEVMK